MHNGLWLFFSQNSVIVPPTKFIGWSPNIQHLRMWLCLEKRPKQIIKVRWSYTGGPYSNMMFLWRKDKTGTQIWEEVRPYKDTGRRPSSTNQREMSGTDPSLMVLKRSQTYWHFDLGLLELWENTLFRLSHQVCGIYYSNSRKLIHGMA